jgi:hypothetical protein
MSGTDRAQDAVRAYKDVIGELDAASAALRARDSGRADVLRHRLVELGKVAAEAAHHAALARFAVAMQWDSVVDDLWKEDWLTLRIPPQPDPSPDGGAGPDDVEALTVAVERAAAAVRDAGRRWTFGPRGR